MSALILVVNAGSSSLKLAVFERRRDLVRVDSQSGEPRADIIDEFVARHGAKRFACVAHRVVHGGDFQQPARLDARVEAEIERLAPFAPLHNPFALEAIRACRALLGARVPQVAVFDTAFFAGLPEVARIYAIPRELAQAHGLRRYGFHGIAHCSMWLQWQRAAGRREGRAISLQLGAGCSMAAVENGRALDTSMGFSPLEGLVMTTRCGDIDAGLLVYLQRSLGWSSAKLDEVLNNESGLRGVSGASGDMRDLLASDEPSARLAVELFCYRARKYIGAYLAVLGGVDAILFGGGIGENAWPVRERILGGLQWAGISVDPERNRNAVGAGTAQRIDGSNPDRAEQTAVWVIPVDEAEILAREAVKLLEGTQHA